MSTSDLKKQIDQKMQKTIESFKVGLSKIRTGRAHAGLLDHVQVDYYGNPVPISQVANVSVADARSLSVSPWEKGMIAAIEKAIRESDLGLNPSTQGDIVRVPMPPLTEERRKELVKVVKSEAEDAKVAVRNVRRDANQSLKDWVKDKTISEDESRRSEDEIQKTTDKFVQEIDKLAAQKETEVMSI
jgi:ribosome recycling factor